MTRNPGHLPPEAIGKRINGRLENGREFFNWAADGRNGCNWRRTGWAFDIAFWELAQ